MIRGYPNGVTHPESSRDISPSGGKGTRGIEPSQYPEETESTERPLVAASERGWSPNRVRVKTAVVAHAGLRGRTGQTCRSVGSAIHASRSDLERSAVDGESPVGEACVGV